MRTAKRAPGPPFFFFFYKQASELARQASQLAIKYFNSITATGLTARRRAEVAARLTSFSSTSVLSFDKEFVISLDWCAKKHWSTIFKETTQYKPGVTSRELTHLLNLLKVLNSK